MSAIALDVDGRAAARARLRADVALASRVVPVARPLDEFVAVNPLAGFEDRPFADAIDEARALYGIRGYLTEATYRRLHDDGRIATDDLRWAIRARFPDHDRVVTHDLGGRVVTVEEDLVALLLGADVAPDGGGRSVRTAAEQHDAAFGTDLATAIDQHTIRWCAAFLGTEASWRLPGQERGLYGAWRDLVVHDPNLAVAERQRLADLPDRSDDAVLDALGRLGVGADDHRSVARAELSTLPGWAAHIRWRAEAVRDVDLVDYLALRLRYLVALADPGFVPVAPDHHGSSPGPNRSVPSGLAPLDRRERLALWQAAYERGYRRPLLESIRSDRASGAAVVEPAAQIVCCIDVRSEGLRRAIEAQGPYETLGFAGFFAVAITWNPLTGGEPIASCPALVSPHHVVTETAAEPGRSVARHLHAVDAEAGAIDGVHAAKAAPGSAFVLAEAAGWFTGPVAAARTLAPGSWARLTRWVEGRALGAPASTVDLSGFPLADQILTARTALTTMGLARFAPLVVLCGHTSTTAANPYEAALRCGACGGHGGGPNARVLAAILNDERVRAGLADEGTAIPAGTWFVAAEHDTTSDTITILDHRSIPIALREQARTLQADLVAAGGVLAAQRCADLPGAPASPSQRRARRHVMRRSADWAETFPEWGLAGNAAFVVGPRSITAATNLDRRVFLHSYDAAIDRDGRALETILTAPLIVAQWINCQYYFSTTDPEVFGSGTKTVHNPLGAVGVLSGRTGDLRMGLPRQSVARGDQLVHEPLRLLAAVQAPLDRVAAIVERNPTLRDLVAGEWIHLVAREADGEDWSGWSVDGWTDER